MTTATKVTGNLKLDIENLRAGVDSHEMMEISIGEWCRLFVAKHGDDGKKAYLADILSGKKYADMSDERKTYYKKHQQRLNRATASVERDEAIAGLSKAQVIALDKKAETAKKKASGKRKADAKAKVIASVAESPKAVVKLCDVQIAMLQKKERASYDLLKAVAAWTALKDVYSK
jgi:hypothetical protein